jgi:anti-sigma factor RsiW
MNSPGNCHNLDAYLLNDLLGDERATFESHLEECPPCSDVVEQQQWIDDLLHSGARIELERPSATIFDSFCVSLAQRRRRVTQATCGLAAAATLLVAVGLWALNRQMSGLTKVEQQSTALTESAYAPPPAQPPATFVSTSDAIVVPLESQSADVSIVQVYPTTDAERRWRLKATLSTSL